MATNSTTQAPMTDERLAEIEARANAATPGPWAWEPTGEKSNSWCMGTVDPPHVGQIPTRETIADGPEVIDWIAQGGDDSSFADPEFLTHAREDIPALAAEVRRLRTDAAKQPPDEDTNALVGAIRAFTVEAPNNKPNGPAEAAMARLAEALDPKRWRPTSDTERRLLAQANREAAALMAALAEDTKALRVAAEAFFGGDFRKPSP